MIVFWALVIMGSIGMMGKNSPDTESSDSNVTYSSITYSCEGSTGATEKEFTITLHTDGTTSSVGLSIGLNDWELQENDEIYIQPDMEGKFVIDTDNDVYDVYDEKLGSCKKVKN